MCGLVGVITFEDKRNLKDQMDVLISMRDSLTHRGPDEAGFHLDDNVYLGHRRLSIIDLEGGKQPMYSEDGNFVVIYNGEIYNFREIREELKEKGHVFKTLSDTEVLLRSFVEYGPDCVKKFIGMFAFAVWDRKKKELFLARDHFGIKPMYYAPIGNKIIFASEIKAILKHPDIRKEIDPKALSQYFLFEYVPDPLSMFKGIYKLEPASFLIFNKNGLMTEKYWRINLDPVKNVEEKDVQERLLELLRRSVKRRMISDVPVGSLLSGGLDSSTIFALMNEVAPGDIRTFTIGFEEISFDESDYARQLAKHFMSYHHEFRIRPHQLIEYIPKVVRALDEPLGDSAIVITNFLHEMTSRHVKVALGGEGGDELLAGYQHIIAHRFANLIRGVPKRIFDSTIKNFVNNLPVAYDYFSFEFKAKKFLSGLAYTPLQRNQIWLGSYSPEDQKALFSQNMNDQLGGVDPFAPMEEVKKYINTDDLISQVLMLDFNMYLPCDILTLVDRASMATSLEVRVPFLDRELVEYVVNLPTDFKIRNFTSKYILRKTMEGILPNNIIKRKKVGLNIPASKWIKEDLKTFVQDVFSESFIKRQKMFDHKYISRLLNEHFQGRKDNRKQIWTLMMFELWYKEYMER